MAYSARPTSTNELTQLVNLNTHGFFVGQCVIFNGAWTLAKADTMAHSEGTWIVSIVPDVNSFYVTQTGWVNNLNPIYFDAGSITAGVQYYLSALNSGKFSTVIPASAGNSVLPCLVCDTTTTGYFYGGSGTQVESGPLFNWTVSTVNTNMGPNQGYFTTSGGTLNMTLPPTGGIGIGDIVRVSNLAGNFSVLTNAGQTINFGDELVMTSITSVDVGDTLELVCYQAVPNALYQVLSSMGNLTWV